MGQPWGLTGTGPIQEGSQLGSRLHRKARVRKDPKAQGDQPPLYVHVHVHVHIGSTCGDQPSLYVHVHVSRRQCWVALQLWLCWLRLAGAEEESSECHVFVAGG